MSRRHSPPYRDECAIFRAEADPTGLTTFFWQLKRTCRLQMVFLRFALLCFGPAIPFYAFGPAVDLQSKRYLDLTIGGAILAVASFWAIFLRWPRLEQVVEGSLYELRDLLLEVGNPSGPFVGFGAALGLVLGVLVGCSGIACWWISPRLPLAIYVLTSFVCALIVAIPARWLQYWSMGIKQRTEPVDDWSE